MRIFWGILGLLIIALAVMLVMRGRTTPSSFAPDPTPTTPAPAAPQPGPAANAPTPPAAPAPASTSIPASAPVTAVAMNNVAEPDVDTQVRATTDGFEVTPAAPSVTPTLAPPKTPDSPTSPSPTTPPTPSTPNSASPNPDPSPLDDTTDPILQAIQEQMTGEAPRPINLTPVAPLPHTIAAPSSTSAPAASSTAKPASSSAAANQTHSVVRQDDGTTLVDNRYIMKGSGTKADPYRITWEQLVSADEVYQPRLGRKVLPERVKMLDGKWVRMSGYIAFPIMATSQDEMLLMLNQWDGCCIGVPPTPFDAVEVKLNAAAKGETRLRATGTVQGILRVDPYLVKDWLVSLYLMDNADLVESGGMQPAESPVHGK